MSWTTRDCLLLFGVSLIWTKVYKPNHRAGNAPTRGRIGRRYWPLSARVVGSARGCSIVDYVAVIDPNARRRTTTAATAAATIMSSRNPWRRLCFCLCRDLGMRFGTRNRCLVGALRDDAQHVLVGEAA